MMMMMRMMVTMAMATMMIMMVMMMAMMTATMIMLRWAPRRNRHAGSSTPEPVAVMDQGICANCRRAGPDRHRKCG
eukprot:2757801-Pyramimonas_sp.AAC.1